MMDKRFIVILTFLVIVGVTAGVVFYLSANNSQKNKDAIYPDEPAADYSDEEATPSQAESSEIGLTPIDFEDEAASVIEAESENEPAVEMLPAEDTGANAPAERIMERFTIAIGQNDIATVARSLREQGFIDDEAAFKTEIDPKILALVAGGYKLSKDMDENEVATALQEKPYMKWIIVPEGLRKEEVARILADELGWTAEQQIKWANADTTAKSEYIEGVYFPDTYLIPIDEIPAKVAERMQARFNEAFAAYLLRFNEQNIKWTTGLTFASVVQREAKNAADMPLIAGILWNRLEQGMALNADATLQYARGDTGNGWWAPAKAADKAIDSPYNTYTYKGLPPHPICSPGVAAIEATLAPAETDCLYYLHGNDGTTHCAAGYEEHLNNIELYLKSGQ